MSSTTAVYSALSGINASTKSLDVTGNNIANVNTTAFKSSRTLFSTQFSRTLSVGSQPGEDTGGTNPNQIGLGVSVAAVQRSFAPGTVSPTGDGRDLAIEGEGFFVLNRDGERFYTRSGAFRLDALNNMVNQTGETVMGYGVDENFQIVEGDVIDLNVPLGQLTLAEATSNVQFGGNLNAGGASATQGSLIRFAALALVTGPIGGVGGPVLDLTSRLVEVSDADAPAVALFAAGQTLRLDGAEKGGKTTPGGELLITDATTVAELAAFLELGLAVDPATGPNPDGNTPGVTLDPASGVLSLVGNAGSLNDLVLRSQDLRLFNADDTAAGSPLVPTKEQSADGESVRTTFVVYDSLGNPVTADLSMVLVTKDNDGTVWRYQVESQDGALLGDSTLSTGTVRFDSLGRLVGEGLITADLDRTGSGAVTPLSISIQLDGDAGTVTSLSDVTSSLASAFQDGTPIGTLSGYGVGIDGTIIGTFSNGLTRTLGQVVLAKFTNQEGLVDAGGSLYTSGPNSGNEQILLAGSRGTGKIVSGALEASNVDLAQEFINMILASTAYSASARVITSVDQLLQQLLVVGR